MASTTRTVISPEELRTFRYQYVVAKYGQQVLCEIFRANFLINSSKSLSEQLQDIEIYNKTRKTLERIGISFKMWFNAREFEKIDKNEPLESFDITLLFKIFHKFWDNKVKEPSEDLKVLVKKVKDERNAVSHEDLKFTQSELTDKLKEFEKTLHEALDEAAKLYLSNGASFVALRSEISKDIASIQEKIRENLDPLNPEDYQKLKKEMEAFKAQVTEAIQERSISDLISICERITIQPFDWLPQYIITDPSNLMVSLQMDTDKALHAVQSRNQPLTVNQNDILTTKEPSGGNPEVVIISGDAGAGKTTLLSFMLEKWSKKEYDVFSDLSSYDILLHMAFRSHDVDSFDAYIKDHFKELVADYDIQNVKQAILKLRCLIICDGFDEKNEKSLDLFQDILKLNSSGMKVIITTRPMHTLEVTDIVNRAGQKRLNLSLLGLTNERQLSLIEKFMHYLKPDINERKTILEEINSNFSSINPRMKELLRNPLYLSLYVVIWVECPEVRNSIDTITKLFSVLRKENSKRLKVKLETNKVVVQDEAIPQFEHFYCDHSLKSHLQQYHELTDKDIKAFKEKCNENGLPFESVMSTYFSVKPSRKGLDIVNIWCYRHRSEQEFGAASDICDRILEINNKGAAVYDGNIISHILSSISQEIRDDGGKINEEVATHGGEDEDETLKKGIQSILRYVTGILKEHPENVLEKYINDILDMVHLEEERGVSTNRVGLIIYPILQHLSEAQNNSKVIKSAGLIIDPILQHLSEAQNNSKVIKSAKRKLEDKHVIEWKIIDGKNLSPLPQLLSKTKPFVLKLNLHDDNNDPDSLPGLISSVSAANTHDVWLKVNLWNSYVRGGGTVLSKKILQEGGRTMKEFTGSVCPEGVSFLQEEIRQLDLHIISHEALIALSDTLPSLYKLETLSLRIPFKELRKNSKPLKFTGNELKIEIFFEDELGGDDKAKEVAQHFNELWHQKEKEPATCILSAGFILPGTCIESTSYGMITISNSQFTKTGIKEMITSLKMKGLSSIFISVNMFEVPKLEKLRLQNIVTSSGLAKELIIFDLP